MLPGRKPRRVEEPVFSPQWRASAVCRLILLACLSLVVTRLSPQRALSYSPCCPTVCCGPCCPPTYYYAPCYPVCYRPCPSCYWGWYGPVIYRAPVFIGSAAPILR